MNPILGDLNGYWSGSSTWIFHTPPAKGAAVIPSVCKFRYESSVALTLIRTVEADIELLHVIIDQSDFVIRHEPAGGKASCSDSRRLGDMIHLHSTYYASR